jgi:Lrp/AsnC family leucine-responsive transcriptional regulator
MAKNLDKIDSRLLYELDWDARQSEVELAKKINRSRETVRYRLKHLESKGIILGYVTWINVARMGYQAYKLYLKIGGTQEERKEFLDSMRKMSDLFWLGVADGAWDVGLTFYAKTHVEFFVRKSEIFSKYNRIIIQKFTGVMVEAYFFPKTFLHAKPKNYRSLFGNVKHNKLDQTDNKIISELFRNSRQKTVELASKTGVSGDVVRSRIKKLEENGIIVSYKAVIDYDKLGMEFYKSFLYFHSFSKSDEKKLFEIAKQDPNILHIVKLISPWDIELEIMAESYQKYNAIIRRLKSEFPNLRNVESAVLSEDSVFPARKTVFH